MKKASRAGAFFVFVLFPLSVWSAEPLCPSPLPTHRVKVSRVVDGDTLRLHDGRRLRLIGINAPELGRAGRAGEPYAVQARQRLEQLVKANDNRLNVLIGQESRDRYGRVLAHLFSSDGSNIESLLLADGLGYMVAVLPNTVLSKCQQQVEQSARKAGRGVWKRSPVLDVDQVSQSGFAVVEGKVLDVVRNGGGVWLELDGPVVLQIRQQYLPAFDEESVDGLRGRRIEARGWLVDRSRQGALKPGVARWLLPITAPEMLESLP